MKWDENDISICTHARVRSCLSNGSLTALLQQGHFTALRFPKMSRLVILIHRDGACLPPGYMHHSVTSESILEIIPSFLVSLPYSSPQCADSNFLVFPTDITFCGLYFCNFHFYFPLTDEQAIGPGIPMLPPVVLELARKGSWNQRTSRFVSLNSNDLPADPSSQNATWSINSLNVYRKQALAGRISTSSSTHPFVTKVQLWMSSCLVIFTCIYLFFVI